MTESTQHVNLQQLFDHYAAIMDLRNATTDNALWKQLDHEAKKAWHTWLNASKQATMRSDESSYTLEQGGTQDSQIGSRAMVLRKPNQSIMTDSGETRENNVHMQ